MRELHYNAAKKAEEIITHLLAIYYDADPSDFIPLYSKETLHAGAFSRNSQVRLGNSFNWRSDEPQIKQWNNKHGTTINLFKGLPDRFMTDLRAQLPKAKLKLMKKTASSELPSYYGRKFIPVGRLGDLETYLSPISTATFTSPTLKEIALSSQLSVKEAIKLVDERIERDPTLKNPINTSILKAALPCLIRAQIFNTCSIKPNYDLHPTT